MRAECRRDRVGPRPAEGHTDQAEHRPRRGQRVQPGVFGVGDHRGRLDPATNRKFVAGHQLIAEDLRRGGGGNAPAQMLRGALVDQLGDTFGAGDRGAGPDDRGDTDPSESSARSKP